MENVIQKGVLVSVAEKVSTNVNGTPFYNCTIDYNGKQFGAIMYGTVYDKGIAIGNTVSFSIKFLDFLSNLPGHCFFARAVTLRFSIKI